MIGSSPKAPVHRPMIQHLYRSARQWKFAMPDLATEEPEPRIAAFDHRRSINIIDFMDFASGRGLQDAP